MSRTRWLIVAAVCGALLGGLADGPAGAAEADEAAVAATVERVVEAAGGRDKLLTLFGMRERLIGNPDGVKTGTERVFVLEPPKYWWRNKRDREGEPAKLLVWAWTLGALTDPKSKLTAVDPINDGQAELFGIEVSETITPPLRMYFNKEDKLLARIDWRGSTHRFSEWKELDGLKYASRAIGYTRGGKAWYQSDILELTRLQELPEGLTRGGEGEVIKD